SYDAASVSLHVPRRRLEPALDLLADVVLRPTFADSEVARQRELRRAQIVQLADNPVAMAGIAFPAIVFGRAHPYGRPLNGTEASTTVLSRDRVTEFYRASYRPNAARILIVGDVTLAAARRLLTARLGAWERGSVPALPGAAAPAPASRAVYLVDKPGAAQSVIRIGHVGVARTTPDYFALQVLNPILGRPADFETTAAAAARFRELLVYGLPLDYFAHYAERINTVTAADVQRVARQYIDPDHFDIVIVGDKSQIEAGIKALNEGPIV